MITEDVNKIKMELYIHVVDAVQEGLSVVKDLSDKKEFIGTYHNWPSISSYSNGLPSFIVMSFNAPNDYRKAFRDTSLKSFLSLWNFVKDQAYIKERLLYPNLLIERADDPKWNKKALEISKIFVLSIAEDLIDRYVHIHKKFEFAKKLFDPIYFEYIAGIFEEKLSIHLCIPILFLKFNFDNFTLGPKCRIEKMGTSFQLARAQIKEYSSAVHESVLPAASHMLVLENWHIKDDNRWQLSELISSVSAYPDEPINNFFAALRIATGFDTGYAQLLMRPQGWAKNYKADLPPLYGTSIRAYPSRFENYYWNKKDIPELSSVNCQEVASLYTQLSEVQENAIRLAVKRLNQCFLREEEEDSIIDATIGLEALLSDGSHQEITHKLALRVGALSKLAKGEFKNPYDVFQEIKKIYDCRSALVHGSSKTPKNKEIKMAGRRSIKARDLAMEYLRKVLRILIIHPKYRNPKEIDKELLLNHS